MMQAGATEDQVPLHRSSTEEAFILSIFRPLQAWTGLCIIGEKYTLLCLCHRQTAFSSTALLTFHLLTFLPSFFYKSLTILGKVADVTYTSGTTTWDYSTPLYSFLIAHW